MRMTLMLPAILAAVFCALPLRAEPQALTLQQAIDKVIMLYRLSKDDPL